MKRYSVQNPHIDLSPRKTACLDGTLLEGRTIHLRKAVWEQVFRLAARTKDTPNGVLTKLIEYAHLRRQDIPVV